MVYGEDDRPPSAAAPRRSAALFRSDLSSLSLSKRAFSRGSSTASESYSSESSPFSWAAFAAASFSANFCLRVPFFLIGAAATAFSSSEDSSSDDSSQSLYDTAQRHSINSTTKKNDGCLQQAHLLPHLLPPTSWSQQVSSQPEVAQQVPWP